MTNLGIRGAIVKYFEEHPNTPVYLSDICNATGFTGLQVQSCMSHIIRENKKGNNVFPLDIVQQAQIWEHRTGWVSEEAASNNGTMFELVGQTKDGDVVIRDKSGVLFKATAL
jgi:hypothetical protein